MQETITGCGVQGYYSHGMSIPESTPLAPYLCPNIKTEGTLLIEQQGSDCISTTGLKAGRGSDNPHSWFEILMNTATTSSFSGSSGVCADYDVCPDSGKSGFTRYAGTARYGDDIKFCPPDAATGVYTSGPKAGTPMRWTMPKFICYEYSGGVDSIDISYKVGPSRSNKYGRNFLIAGTAMTKECAVGLVDKDSDSDGIPDAVEGTSDTDSDGIPDYLDPDSDGDGSPDAEEGSGDSDSDGIPDRIESGTANSDSDGTPDDMDPIYDCSPNYLDVDTDGDGSISKAELASMMEAAGLPASDAAIDAALSGPFPSPPPAPPPSLSLLEEACAQLLGLSSYLVGTGPLTGKLQALTAPLGGSSQLPPSFFATVDLDGNGALDKTELGGLPGLGTAAAIDAYLCEILSPPPPPPPAPPTILSNLQEACERLLGLGSYLRSPASLKDKIKSLAPTAGPYISPTKGGKCYISEAHYRIRMHHPTCECHPSCAECGFYPEPVGYRDCILCASGAEPSPRYSDGTGQCN